MQLDSRRSTRVILLCCAPVLTACPPDEVEVGGSETGGPGVPVPLDPLDGEDPPGEPDPDLTWRSPVTLGNGIVHDSRYDLGVSAYDSTFSLAELEAGVDWGDFVLAHAVKRERGFRPTQIDAEYQLIQTASGLALEILDRSVYLSDDDANYRTQVRTHVFSTLAAEQAALQQSGAAGPGEGRPTSIDTFSLAGGELGTSIAWVYDNDPMPWRVVTGLSAEKFSATLAQYEQDQYRPISIASRQRGGGGEYAAIFVRDDVPASAWDLSVGLDWTTLNAEGQTMWDAGFYPVRAGYRQGSDALPTFDILWARRAPELSLEIRYNMDETTFPAEDVEWREQGYHLESAMSYVDSGATRYAGMWVRYEPYLRVASEDLGIDESSQAFIDAWDAKYGMFDARAIQAMTLAGDPREGEFYRQASTLHIFEGSQLVVSRAYTFAPAIYPDTPVGAPMGLASASKSITAAAVVRVLNTNNVSIGAPFVAAAGFANQAPAQMQTNPSVVEVLRNVGGFMSNVDSYGKHALIHASPWGQYPISGKMMYDYVIGGGHLDSGGSDSYWEASQYAKNQTPVGAFLYSNPGWTMLGELVRVQSGVTYDTYVVDNLLAPLNLVGRIYPAPGHRNAVEMPPKAGLRCYLSNTGHFYHSVECAGDDDCAHLPQGVCGADGMCIGCMVDDDCTGSLGCVAGACRAEVRSASESVPRSMNTLDQSPRWADNGGPPDPSAPKQAAYGRYAGSVYMGGAPLAAGGWNGDGEALGILMRAIAGFGFLMPQPVAAQLWAPQWWNPNQSKSVNWSYGLGWYVRGNWVAWAGGADGAMSMVMYNRAYDFTVVYLSNVIGNGFQEFVDPLLDPGGMGWSSPGNPSSDLGGPFPCVDDPATVLVNECLGPDPY